jgi:type IV pilus assembly protein PilC
MAINKQKKTRPVRKTIQKKELIFEWEGKDRSGKAIKGSTFAESENVAKLHLRRQGINVTKIKKKGNSRARIRDQDIAIFTRQLATMLRAGVPLLQAFDIVAKGSSNPAMTRLLFNVRRDIESGHSLSQAFSHHPMHFDALFCNIIAAGETGGVLDSLLDRLANYKEKMLSIKGKIKSALMYPIAVLGVAFLIIAGMMIWVIPTFKEIFDNFGAELPGPTRFVMGLSEFFVENWYFIFGGLGGGMYALIRMFKSSPKFQEAVDRYMLRMPIFGSIIQKATIARWTSTLATLFAAGVPLVEALDTVGGASGNRVYIDATKEIKKEVVTGSTLTFSMQRTELFPSMVLQMVAIGEEAGSLEHMLLKVSEFYEEEVDQAVDGLSSLMEPIIIVVLGTLVGGIVIAMYLPIFNMGTAVG